MDFDPEGMTMNAGALVAFRHVRQAVRRLDLENPENIHGRIVPPGHPIRNGCTRKD